MDEDDMSTQSTCGQGLAAHSAFIACLAEFVVSMADVLEDHQAALDLTDHATHGEHRTYVTLTLELRAIGTQLAHTARHLASAHDLPMGRHDHEAMASPKARAVFERLVHAEQALQSRLVTQAEQHERLLSAMPS
jgi:hypothetical protein